MSRQPLVHRAGGLLVCLLVVACSVTEPRDAALTVRQSAGSFDGVAVPGADDRELDGSLGTGAADEAGPGLTTPGAGGARSSRAAGTGSASPGGAGEGGGGGGTAVDTGPAGPNPVGVTDDSIVVSVAWPFSGVFAQIYENMFETAIVTWAEEVNSQGGIHGRKVVLKKVDNQGTVDGQVAACREIQSNGSFVALIEGSISNAEADCLDEAGFPALSFLSETRAPTWTSVRSALSSESARAIGSFVRGPVGGAGKKVGVIAVQNFPGYLGAARDGLREAGLEVVKVEIVAQNQASFVSELLRLREAGAEVVVVITGAEVIGILRDAHAISYRPIFTGTPWPADELSLPAGDLMQGMKGLRSWTTQETQAAQQYRELAAKHGNGSPVSSSVAQYGTVIALGRALELAGPQLNRESMRAGFDRIEGFATGLIPPLTFAGGRTVGTIAQFPVECCTEDRNWFAIGEPASSF